MLTEERIKEIIAERDRRINLIETCDEKYPCHYYLDDGETIKCLKHNFYLAIDCGGNVNGIRKEKLNDSNNLA